MALPVDPRIEALLAAARGQVAGGNATRQQSALLAALGLTSSGLLERSDATLQGTADAGFAEAPGLMNETYGVKQGPQGSAFRQAATSINNSAAARGVGASTGTSNQNLLAQRDLFARIQSMLQNFSAAQNTSLQQQGQGLGQLGQNIANIRFEQAQEAAAAPPPVPAAPAALSPETSSALSAASTGPAGSGGSGDTGFFSNVSNPPNNRRFITAWGRRFAVPGASKVTGPAVKRIPTAPLVRR